MTKKFFYERNDYLLNHQVNKTFDEILAMSEKEFRFWIIQMRKAVAYAWDVLGTPPTVGKTEEEILEIFNRMSSFPVEKFEEIDELTGDKNVINNTHKDVVGACNAWFPGMMKTRINYKNSTDGLSIYDHFVKDELLEKVVTYARRHFKRDSFYHHSRPVNQKDNFFPKKVTSAVEWIRTFESNRNTYDHLDYWLACKDDDKVYTGYADADAEESLTVFDDETHVTDKAIKSQKYWELTEEEFQSVKAQIPPHCLSNISATRKEAKNQIYQIRLFEKGQKVFPVGFKAFRISWCQYAVNFPPLTAKYLYERFTDHIKDQSVIKVYDPSSGWGGRILGAMSVKTDRFIHYIGTDPNTDHTIELENGTKSTKYANVASYFNSKTYRGRAIIDGHANSYELYQLGSEVIRNDPGFQKHKGDIDMVFTSPPYFAKESYSDDPEQSYKKFGQYDLWREGFLKPTLETAVEYLKNNRYLLWNIADAKFGNDMLPLEKDSRDILESLGMKYITTMKMALAQMPGGNRINPETGLPMAKNFCKVNGIWLKYEPIFVYLKP